MSSIGSPLSPVIHPASALDAPASALPPAALAAWVDASPNGLLLIDTSGRVRWANRAFARITGKPASAGVGQRLLDLLHADEAEPSTRQWMQRRMTDGVGFEAVEVACRHADGSPLWLSASLAPTPDGFAATLVDVTQLHREVHERQRLAELLDMAQEFGRIGVWERNLRTFEGRWDRHVFRFWGLPPSDHAPSFEDAEKAVHPDDRIDGVLRERMTQVGVFSHRHRVIQPDGSVRLLHSQWEVKNGADGKPERAVGIMMDDTEVYELARSASEAHEQLNMAVDLADIVIWRHDLKTGQLTYNSRAWQILDLPVRDEGLTLEETRSFVHPDDLARVEASAERALASDRPVDIEARYRRQDGSWRYVLNRRVAQREPNGTPVAFVGVALDVTEEVASSRRAVELSRRLEAAARAAHIGMWTVDVATGTLEWNTRMSELFGIAHADAPRTMAEWLARCVHPQDVARVRDLAMKSLKRSSELIEVEYRTLRPDGSVRWMINRSNFDKVDDRRHVFGVSMDVTDHRATMDALRDAGERSRLAARGIGMGTWELDLQSGATFWNDQMFILRGLEPRDEPLTPDERRALVHPDDVSATDVGLEHALTEGRPTDYEFRVRLPDGYYRWIASRSVTVRDEQGRAMRRIGVNWDITDSKNADLARQEKAIALHESEAKSRFLARMSHELRTPLNAVLGFTQLLLTEAGQADPAVMQLRLGHIRSAGQHLLALINEVLELSSADSGELPMARSPVQVKTLVAGTLPLVERMAHEYGIKLTHGVLRGTAMADPMRLRQVLLNLLSNAIKYNRAGGSVTIESRVDEIGVRIVVSDTGRGMTPHQMLHAFEPFNRLGAEREGIEGTGIGLAIVKAMVERMGGAVSVSSEPGRGSRFEVLLQSDRAATASSGIQLKALDALTTSPPMPDELAAVAAPAAVAPTPEREPRRGRLLYIEDNPVNVMIVSELVALRPGLRLDVAADGETGVAQAITLQPDLILVDMQLPGIDGHEVQRRLRSDARTDKIPCIALSANAMQEDIQFALQAGFVDYWTKPLDFRAFMASIDALFGTEAIGLTRARPSV